MNDLLLLLLLFVTLHNVFTLGLSFVRVWGTRARIPNEASISFSSDAEYYRDLFRKKGLQKSLITPAIAFTMVGAFISNSFVEYVVLMLVVGGQSYGLYHLYKKGKPVYYLTKKGVYCVLLVPSLHRDESGFKAWERMTYAEENGNKLYLCGDTFQFHIQSQDMDMLQQGIRHFLPPAMKKGSAT